MRPTEFAEATPLKTRIWEISIFVKSFSSLLYSHVVQSLSKSQVHQCATGKIIASEFFLTHKQLVPVFANHQLVIGVANHSAAILLKQVSGDI